ncbi:DUF6355 family natural product biosynthesis protein [Amycolatopsis sp. NPDC059021]|uniref:DUF6355 family natural product biosynthesis protein n=1 Tax=Amycolatopsis sp. NPDC059021 TaxID=3346704 RepID=UPI00366C12F5
MSRSSRVSRVRMSMTGAAAAVTVAGGLIGTALPASAVPVSTQEPCGYLGWGQYRHCDGGTGSTVMLDVQDIWGTIYNECVGPGVHDLQPGIRWRVTGAWWNGGVGCIAGGPWG